jgi:hypothetical protein
MKVFARQTTRMKQLMRWPDVVPLAQRWKSDPDSWREYSYQDGAFNRLVVTDLAESWGDFLGWSEELGGWGFRGQREGAWTLQSSLERDAAHGGIRVSYSYGSGSGVGYPNRRAIENILLSKFQCLAALHLNNLPTPADITGWLSLMQHYGGPTRLMDWTECPFVGMYFAARKEMRNPCALWAVDLHWLEEKAEKVLGHLLPTRGQARLAYLNALLAESETPLVVRIDPHHRNERVAVQKGFFLWKTFDKTPLFDHMLMDMMLNPEIVTSPVIRKLLVGPNLRERFLGELRRKGIREEELFPGKDFCEPLKLELQSTVRRFRTDREEEIRAAEEAIAIGG